MIEVASPSTRTVDRTRKLADYRLGGAGLYVLVDLPAPGPASEATFEVHDFSAEQIRPAAGAIALTVASRPLRLDLVGIVALG
jgi:hypothetical protein